MTTWNSTYNVKKVKAQSMTLRHTKSVIRTKAKCRGKCGMAPALHISASSGDSGSSPSHIYLTLCLGSLVKSAQTYSATDSNGGSNGSTRDYE